MNDKEPLPAGQPLEDEQARRKEQRSWYFYDWANSAYVLVVGTALFAPYLTSVANAAACPDLAENAVCDTTLSVLGLPVAPGALALYVVTASTLLSAVTLPIIGAYVDRSAKKRYWMAVPAMIGGALTMGMFFVQGTNWQLGASLAFIANLCLGASIVAESAIMIDISHPDERDRVSSRGWALGYIGSVFLLIAALALVMFAEPIGISEGLAVRLSLAASGLWWAGFTLVPFFGLRDRLPRIQHDDGAGIFSAAFGQLYETAKQLPKYPQTLLFLAAFLLFNDGIQTVIYAASLFGIEELEFDTSVVIVVLVIVQFAAFVGSLIFGWVAERIGAKKTVQWGLLVWCFVVLAGFFLPPGQLVPFLLVGLAIGLVLGGTQALTRSVYSHLIPNGREAEYVSLYQAAERGTSWFGTLTFGLVFQLTQSYRPALVSLLFFFVVGGGLLLLVNVRKGIDDVGNTQPRII